MSMKNLLLFGPFLWLRRVVLFVLIIAVIVGFVLFFAVNSPLVVQKAADAFAGDYNITYDDIKGNALTGIEIVNPKFKNKKLAKNLQLKWNPNTLVAKQISVAKLHVADANWDVIKGMIDSFSSEENTTQADSNGSSFDFTVNVKNIDLNLEPFSEQNIYISKASLTSDALNYDENGLDIEGLDFILDTNVTNISLRGELKQRVVTLSDATLADVNLSALIALFTSEDNGSVQKSSVDESEAKSEEVENIFIPKIVKIENFKTNILPVTFEPVKIKQIQLNAKNLTFDVESLVVKDAIVDINASSNLIHLSYAGSIQDNHLLGEVNLKPNNRLYELYGLPLRKEAIANIVVDFNASTENLVADISAKGKHILEGKKGEFNVDVDSFVSHVEYEYSSTIVKANTQATVTTPYAKDILLTNAFVMDDNISYSGEIKAKKLIGFDAKLTKPLQDIIVKYEGDDKSIHTVLNAKNLKGTFASKDFKTALVHLETTEALKLSEIVELPKDLKATKVGVVVDAPLDFKNLTSIKAKVKVTSNVANADLDVNYGKDISLKGILSIPKESLLKAYSPDVKWKALSKIDTFVNLGSENVALKLRAKALDVNMNYGLKLGNIKGKVNLAGLSATISGNTKETLRVQTKIKSMSALGKSILSLYELEELPPIKGNIDVNLLVTKMQTAELSLKAPKLVYQADKKTKHIIKDVQLVASMDDSKVVLKSYKATFNNQKYFSNKAATVSLGETINVTNFWVNDELQVSGDYNTKTKKGTFVADAKNFHIKDKMADIYAKIHLKTQLDGDSTIVDGKIVLLKGKVTPNLQAGKSFASDSDIIILQEMKKKKKSPFMDNLSLALKIETKEALRLKEGPINIRLKPDFGINKSKGTELLYLGSVELVKGGSYVFEKKRFKLGKSFVYFTGDVAKPLLDIKANYKSLNHLITIAVAGTPATPNINFSSNPSLSREQILSVILFDSEAGGDAKSGNDMMKMMGGAMAKSALSDVGVDVDHLAFGEGNSIEVGKKLTNKITVIYINGEIPEVKLKYQHGKRTESVIGVSEESQSYDIIYKRDF